MGIDFNFELNLIAILGRIQGSNFCILNFIITENYKSNVYLMNGKNYRITLNQLFYFNDIEVQCKI